MNAVRPAGMSAALDWQRPNNTEGSAWERLQQLRGPMAAEYVPFPWASWIDAVHRRLLPPEPPLRLAAGGVRATVCQHIWALEHRQAFEAAGITDLFWSHARIDQERIGGLRLHPFPLFPVRCHDHPPAEPLLPPQQRPLLYSFLGFHQPQLYPTATRRWLLDLPPRPDALLGGRSEWHFEQQVYQQQVHGRPGDRERLAAVAREAQDYAMALQQSCFALCPSGAGPNSIRLWEALGYGAIPVLLSDALRLPGPASLWRQAVLSVPEQEAAVAALPERLEALRREPGRLAAMQRAGRLLWRRYGLPGLISDLQAFLADPDRVLCQRALARLPLAPGSTSLLQAQDPVLLPLQVLRWRRQAAPGHGLLVQLRDDRPLAEQNLRWCTAVGLCHHVLGHSRAGHPIAGSGPVRSWALCSRVPSLEQLAAGGAMSADTRANDRSAPGPTLQQRVAEPP